MLPVRHSFSFPASQLAASWVIGLYWFTLQIFLQLHRSNLAQQMPDWQEAAAIYSDLKNKNKKINLLGAENMRSSRKCISYFRLTGLKCSSFSQTVRSITFHVGYEKQSNLPRVPKETWQAAGAIWQPQTNKCQNLVAAKNNSVL